MKFAALVCFLAFVAAAASQVVDKAVVIEITPEEAAATALKVISESVSTASKTPAPLDAKTGLWCPLSICPAIYRPVCGFSLCLGLRTFSNLCVFNSQNSCNFYSSYTLLFKGPCELLVRCNRIPFYATLPKDQILSELPPVELA